MFLRTSSTVGEMVEAGGVDRGTESAGEREGRKRKEREGKGRAGWCTGQDLGIRIGWKPLACGDAGGL